MSEPNNNNNNATEQTDEDIIIEKLKQVRPWLLSFLISSILRLFCSLHFFFILNPSDFRVNGSIMDFNMI